MVMNRTIKPLRKAKAVKSVMVSVSSKDRILEELALHSSPVQSKVIAKNLDLLYQSVCIVLEVLYREGSVTTNGMTGQFKKWSLVREDKQEEDR